MAHQLKSQNARQKYNEHGTIPAGAGRRVLRRQGGDAIYGRGALPTVDPELSRAYYQTIFDKLDANGVILARPPQTTDFSKKWWARYAQKKLFHTWAVIDR